MTSEKVAYFYKINILDKLPEDIRAKVAIAGGAVRDKLMGAEIKDIDLFVQDKETEDKLMTFLKNNGKEGNINSQTANYTYEGKWVQVVREKYYDMSTTQVIDSFDFTICQAMVTVNGLKVGEHFWESIATKHLRINKITFPLSTLERMQKYIKKGYEACNGTLLAIAKSINDMERTVFTPDMDTTKEEAVQNTLMFYSDRSPRFMGVD